MRLLGKSVLMLGVWVSIVRGQASLYRVTGTVKLPANPKESLINATPIKYIWVTIHPAANGGEFATQSDFTNENGSFSFDFSAPAGSVFQIDVEYTGKTPCNTPCNTPDTFKVHIQDRQGLRSPAPTLTDKNLLKPPEGRRLSAPARDNEREIVALRDDDVVLNGSRAIFLPLIFDAFAYLQSQYKDYTVPEDVIVNADNTFGVHDGEASQIITLGRSKRGRHSPRSSSRAVPLDHAPQVYGKVPA